MFNLLNRGAWLAAAGLLHMVALMSQVQAQVSTRGQFQVSGGGAATYSIPIQTPTGVSGMEPKLSLEYSSQFGNGLLGIGWNLAGLGSVSRCPRTMAQDGVRGNVNYDLNDRYCLEGQRLIAVKGVDGADGTEYRTERESFAKVVSYGVAGNGPAWFKVWSKSGLVMEYGSDLSGRIELPGGATLRTWALSRISDTRGNYLSVTYMKDPDTKEAYPVSLSYSGSQTTSSVPANKVQFTYEARSDVAVRHYAYAIERASVRLSRIDAYASGQLTKSYVLSYENSVSTNRSRLKSLKECGSDACLPPVNFEFTDFSPTMSNASEPPLNWTWKGYKVLATGDFNGDGITDLYVNDENLGVGAIPHIWYGQPGGGFRDVSLPVLGASWVGYKVLAIGDFNGDGYADIYLNADNLGAGVVPHIWYGQSADGFIDAILPVLSSSWNGMQVLATGDFNGDGLTDLYLNSPNLGGGMVPHIWYGQATTLGFRDVPLSVAGSSWNGYKVIATGDFNGDGRTDIYINSENLGAGMVQVILYGRGEDGFRTASLPALHASWNGYKVIATGDFNGDGTTDLYFNSDSMGAPQNIFYGLSSGDGFRNVSLPALPGSWNGYKVLAVGDFNGDGLTDVYLNFGNPGQGGLQHIWYGKSSADGFRDVEMAAFHASWNGYVALATGDFNGDGVSEIYFSDPGLGNGAVGHRWGVQGGNAPDLLQRVSNGAIAQVEFSYLPLTNSTVYQRPFGRAPAPVVNLQPATYAVNTVAVPDGLGGVIRTKYSYGNLRAEVGTGRGLLGFGWIQIKQLETGLTSYTEYRQDWPYVGLPSLVKKTLANGGNGGVLSQTTTSYGCNDPSASSTTACTIAPGKRYFVYAKQSVENSWDYNGTALPVITTSSEYDNWGNAMKVEVATDDGFKKSTVNTYANDSVNWYLGRLLKSSVTSTAP